MPRYDDRDRYDRHDTKRIHVGHLASRTRSRDLEDIFSRYGRIRDVDMKRDFAFVEFSDPRDADDARYSLNGRDVDGSRIVVEFSKGVPRGGGSRSGYSGSGSREYLGRGPPPGLGRCFNCGLDGHWARDCKAGDWKNKCYRCGDRGHIERNCQNSPKKAVESKRGRSYSRTPSPPRRGRSRSPSYSRSHSYSRSRSPTRRERRKRSPRRYQASPPPSKGRNHSPSPADSSPEANDSPSPKDKPIARSNSPMENAAVSPIDRSPAEENGRSRSPSQGFSSGHRDHESPADDGNNSSPRGSESD